MANYFRITAYHPAKNVCAIFDSNGRFEKLWQFSSYLATQKTAPQEAWKQRVIPSLRSGASSAGRLSIPFTPRAAPPPRADLKEFSNPLISLPKKRHL